MADVIIYSVMDIYLIGIATILSLITAFRYFGLAKRKENQIEKSMNNAYAWMFIFLTIYLILLNISFFYIEGKYIGFIYMGNYENPSLIYMWLTKFTYIFFIAAFIFYFYTYEKILNKNLHFAPILCLVIIILIIIIPYKLAINQLYPIAGTIMSLYLIHTFFTLMKKSQRELRAATSFIILGTWFMGTFVIFMGPTAMELGDTPILIFPALFIIGILLCMSPTLFKPEFFSRDIRYWYLFSIIYIGLGGISLIYYITISNVIMIGYSIIALIFLIFYIIECIILIRFIKHEKILGVNSNIGVRGIFTKPEKVTEEEVSISKEKKICLVCKGKISGFETFLCPNCETFYCHRCARALSNLENVCWSCNTPIDKTKPVKLVEKETELVIIEEMDK